METKFGRQKLCFVRSFGLALVASLYMEAANCAFITPAHRNFMATFPTRTLSTCAISKARPCKPQQGCFSLRAESKDASSEEDALRKEYEEFLSGSGRGIGMKSLKPPKGTLAALQKPAAKPKKAASPGAGSGAKNPTPRSALG